MPEKPKIIAMGDSIYTETYEPPSVSDAMREAVDASLKATRRPWKVFDQNGVIEIQDADSKEIIHWSGFDQSRRSNGARRANARFIVALANAIGPIASEIARLTGENTRLDHNCQEWVRQAAENAEAADRLARRAEAAEAALSRLQADRRLDGVEHNGMPEVRHG